MAKDFDPMIGKKTQFKSGESAAENGKKGGEMTAKRKQEQKTFAEMLRAFGNLKVEGKDAKKMAELGIEEQYWTRQMQGVISLYGKMLKGDVAAFNAIRDTIGEKPVDKTQFTGAVDSRIEIGYVETGIDPVSSEEDVEV